ncbi:MAG TPA: hypothetical protein VHZ55_28320 [Bryobacteraceae bacterium]|jgi:hypothetical protein|nr:hypothetical protein [Bryobacteraceae bacterium]
MASNSKTTKNHDEIRAWADARGGKPAHVATTGSSGDIGILRIEFPGAPASDDSSLEEISWDQFFEKFDERGLALLYQEETAGGEKSNFNKLVAAETAANASKKSRRRPSAASHKTTAKKAGAKSAAKKSVAKKTVAKKSVAKKSAPAKKSAIKSRGPVVKKKAAKTAARRAVAKKTMARSAAAKKPLKRTATRKRR